MNLGNTASLLAEQLAQTDALIFDFDGTLAPNLDLPDMKRQVIELTLTFDVPPAVIANAMIVEVVTLAYTWLRKQRPASAAGYHAQAHALITDIEMTSAAATNVFAAAPTLLQRWRARGGRSAIVTRNCRAAVLATYPAASAHVDLLLARDDVEHLKPDPRHLQQALARLQTEPARSIMIGDGAMDMQIGTDCGAYTVGVLSGSSSAQRLEEAGADHVLADISCFLPALDSLSSTA